MKHPVVRGLNVWLGIWKKQTFFFVVVRKAVLRIGRFLRSRAVGARGGGHGPPEFLQISQPYQTRWADYDHHIAKAELLREGIIFQSNYILLKNLTIKETKGT